jgi:hypothetical protein
MASNYLYPCIIAFSKLKKYKEAAEITLLSACGSLFIIARQWSSKHVPAAIEEFLGA